MTIGLCLLALASQATSNATLPIQQPSKPKKASSTRAQDAQTNPQIPPGARPPKPVSKTDDLFRNVGLSLSRRVESLVGQISSDEKLQFLSIHQKPIDRLAIPGFDWSIPDDSTSFPHPIGIGASFDTDLAARVAIELARSPESSSKANYINAVPVNDPRWGEAADSFGEDPLLVARLAAAVAAAYRTNHAITVVGKLGQTARTIEGLHAGSAAISSRELNLSYFAPLEAVISGCPTAGLWVDRGASTALGDLLTPYFLSSTIRKRWGLTGPLIFDPFFQSFTASKTSPAVSGLLEGDTLFSDEQVKALLDEAKNNPDVAKAIDAAVVTNLTAEIAAGRFDSRSEKNAPNHPPEETAQVQTRAARESIVLLKNEKDILPLKPTYKTVCVIGPNADSPSALLGPGAAPVGKIVTPLEAIRKAFGDKAKVTYERGTGLIRREDLQTVPAEAFSDGLTGEYYDRPDLTGIPVTRKETSVDFHWKDAPIEGISSKSFSASWTGVINPKNTGTYGIGVTAEGSARLYVDDQLVVDEWKDGPTRTKIVPMEFEAGQFYVVRLEYAHGKGEGSVRLVYSTPEKEPYRAAVEAAIKSDLVILVLGSDPSLENGTQDRASIDLPDSQQGLLEQMILIHRPTVLVMLNGGPISVPAAKKDVDAIVEAWYPGEAGGTAIADALFGAFNPSGKLPVTVYQTLDQLPDLQNVDAPSTYRNSLYRPLFPFGFGLSYTKFTYSDLSVPSVFDPTKPLRIYVKVKNIGQRDGDEVAQLYISHELHSAKMPRTTLGDFKRVHLASGETRLVSFTLTQQQLAVLHDDGSWWMEPERIRISVGGNQPLDDQPKTLTAHTKTLGAKSFKLQG